MSALQDFDQKLSTFIKFRPAPTADEQYGAWFATVYEFTEKTARAMGLASSVATPAVKVQPVETRPSAEIALPSYGKLAEAKEAIFEQNLRYFDSWPRCWNTNQAADLCDPARRVIECLQLGSEDELDRLQQTLGAGAGYRFLALLRERYGEALKSYVTQRVLRQMIEDFLAAESRFVSVALTVEPKAAETEQTKPTQPRQAVMPTELPPQCGLWEDAVPAEVPADEEEAEPVVDTVQNLMAEASAPGQVLSFPELYSVSVEKRTKLLIKTLASATDDDWGFKDGLATCPELLLTAAQALKYFSLKELAQYIREGKQRNELKTILSARKPEHAGFAFWQELVDTHVKAEETVSDVVPMVSNVVKPPVKSLNEEASSNFAERPNDKVARVLTVNPDGRYDIRYRYHRETMRAYARALASDIKSLGLAELTVAVRAFGNTNGTAIQNSFIGIGRIDGTRNITVRKTGDPEVVRILNLDKQVALEKETTKDAKSTKKGKRSTLVTVLTVKADGQCDVRSRNAHESMSAYVRSLIADMEALSLTKLNIAIKVFDEPNLTKIRQCFHNIQYRIDTDRVYSVKRTNSPDVVCISSKPESEKKVYLPRKRLTMQKVSLQNEAPVRTNPELSMPKLREVIEKTLLNGSATMDVQGIPGKEVEESLRHLLDRIRYTGAIDYVCADGVLILEKRAVA